MDKQKQIEEMVIAVYPWLKEVPIEEREQLKENVSGLMVMERLYNAGYRQINEYNEVVSATIDRVRKQTRKETAEKIFSKVFWYLGRYSHIHKYAETATQDTACYEDGNPIEMTSVWDVLTLKKHGMAEYENMKELQDNIECIAKSFLLSEIEKDMGVLQREICKEIMESKE